MWSSKTEFRPLQMCRRVVLAGLFFSGAAVLSSGCVYQPLYGPQGEYAVKANLSQVWVEEVETRAGQQVRNNLIFLLQGGRDNPEARYLARLRIVDSVREFAAVKNVRTTTAGQVTISVSYDLIDKDGNIRVAGGSRVGSASYDRTGQSFANERARRDAVNRAAMDVAEKLRLAIASDLAG